MESGSRKQVINSWVVQIAFTTSVHVINIVPKFVAIYSGDMQFRARTPDCGITCATSSNDIHFYLTQMVHKKQNSNIMQVPGGV